MKSDFTTEFESRIEQLVSAAGYWLTRIQLQGLKQKKRVVVAIDHPQFTRSVTVDDCVQVSRAIDEEVERLLDDQPYDLEVTSSGERRFLRNLEQRQCVVGQNVEVVFDERRMMNDEWKKKISGKLLSVSEKEIKLLEKLTNNEVDITLGDSDCVFHLRDFNVGKA